MTLLNPLLGSHKAVTKMLAGGTIIWMLEEESASKLSQTVGSLHLLAVVGSRIPFSCSKLLQATYTSLPKALSQPGSLLLYSQEENLSPVF